MSRIDPRPGAGRGGRSGRVFDRVLDALSEIDAGKPADLAVRHVESRARDLGANERKELRETVFGILRRRRHLDDVLRRAASAERKRLDELEPPLARRLVVLAHRADRDRSVEALDRLDPRVHRRFARVLARVAGGRLPKRKGDDDAIRYNLPDWLWARLREGLGPEAAHPIAEALTGRAPVTIRVRDGEVEGAVEALEAQGIAAVRTRWSPVGLVVPPGTDLRSTELFRSGWVELQDEGSQLIGLAAVPGSSPKALGPGRRPESLERSEAATGPRVLDACAGAGGKTLQLAESARSVVALEPDEKKRKELRRRLERAGCSAHVEGAELEAYAEGMAERFDIVLVDAPCTGTGTLRRHPELALRLQPSDLDREVARQKRLIAAATRCLRPGGRLVYATCSVLRDENEDLVEYALVESASLRPAPVFSGALAERLGRGSTVRIGPGPSTNDEGGPPSDHGVALDTGPDGFFIAAFERTS